MRAIADLPPEARPHGDRPLVLHFIDGLEIGGSQKIVFDLVRGLGARWDMEIVTRYLDARVHFANFPVCIAPDEASLRAAISRRPAVVHMHYWDRTRWLDQALAVLGAAWPGVPVIENVNSQNPPWLHPAVTHFAYVSEYLRTYYAAAHVGTGELTSVVYPGVDTRKYAARGPAPGEVVGLVYRLENDKLSRDTIEVLIAIVRARPTATILLVGSGSNFGHYVARTRQARVRGRFDFAGLVPFDALPAYYDRMSLFCAPVHTETYGLVVPYAMAKGIPVCGYRVGALEELLGRSDSLVETPEALAALVSRLLVEPERRAALAVGSRERVLERFSLEAMLAAYAVLYAQALEGSGAGSRGA